eukprot:16448-Heterococcus_DN1.PRE.3
MIHTRSVSAQAFSTCRIQVINAFSVTAQHTQDQTVALAGTALAPRRAFASVLKHSVAAAVLQWQLLLF